ncbi:hypothetical protein WJX73_005440 [Symbiochloris irregularis]|uniref:Serine incorporator n=1 Tax=Symbiochloris irregularis TaxID=706552 RepID=A0AAW1PQ75_9CHLO
MAAGKLKHLCRLACCADVMRCCEFSPGVAKWAYLTCFGLTAIATWILRDYSSNGLSYISGLSSCKSEATTENQDRCYGKGAVLRLSFGNFLFFTVHFLALLGVTRKGDWRMWLHSGCWPLQLLGWAALLGMTFALPAHVFVVWAQIARVLSGFFLILQILILLEFVYILNEWLLDRVDQWWAKSGLVVLSIGCYVIVIGIVVVTYIFYAPHGSCSLNIFFITFTLILAVILTIFSVTKWRPEAAGLLTSGCMLAYMAYLLWSALTTEPAPSTCIRSLGTGANGIKVMGFVLAIAATLYATMNSSMASHTFSLSPDPESLAETNPDDSDRLPYRLDFFHLAYMLASAYLAMLFTGWSLNNVPGYFSVDDGWASVWVKMASQWMCALLYGWTLIAPLLLRNRQF